MKKITFLSLLAISAAALAGQSANPVLDKDVEMKTIQALIVDMKHSYVFPKLADESAAKLNSQLAADAYAGLDGPGFAKKLSEDLNAVCHDAHLRVRYFPEKQPERVREDTPTPDEVAAEKRFLRAVNGGVETVQVLPGNIGYMEIRNFLDPQVAEKPAAAAFEFLQNTDALIIDLRRNGGGDPETVRRICSYLFGEQPVHLNDIYLRQGNQTTEFWTNRHVPGPRYLDKEIYVLVSHRTGSGAEEFAYDLSNLHRATIVGEKTWGGANPGGSFRLNDHFAAFIPGGRAINPYTKTNWEGTGVDIDIHVPATQALVEAQRLILEKLLAKSTFPDERDRLSQALKELSLPASPGRD